MRVLREVEGLDGVLAEIAHVEIRVDDHLLHKDFSGLYEEMSGMGASASEAHLPQQRNAARGEHHFGALLRRTELAHQLGANIVRGGRERERERQGSGGDAPGRMPA